MDILFYFQIKEETISYSKNELAVKCKKTIH